MAVEILNEAQKIWDQVSQNESSEYDFLELEMHKKILNIFHVGNFYYYIFDVKNTVFKFISPEIKNVLGYEAKEVDVGFFLSKIHPDDQSTFLNHEQTVIDFFNKLPLEKFSRYKVSYDYRLKDKSGNYVRLLQQVVVLKHDDQKNLLFTLGVHTDISHLKTNNTSALSFIGLDSEPSFYNVEVNKVYKPSKEIFTKRESEIVHYLLKGCNTSTISEALFISKFTVDTHRKNILSKTNTKTTIELAMKLLSEGIA